MNLDAKQFLQRFGREEAARVCVLAGTKLSYFVHLAGGHRNPSTALAKRLVQASDKRLSLHKLLRLDE